MSSNIGASAALILSVLVAVMGVWQLGQAGQIYAKAWLAEVLLEQAWDEARRSGGRVKPWPWADTWPVALLSVPKLGVQRYVLAGDSGHALAFGAGMVGLRTSVSEAPIVTIAGHRDTHFAFLRELDEGDQVVLETAEGAHTYRIQTSLVTEVPEVQVSPGSQAILLLVTCYPFDALNAGGDQRYVLLAERLSK